MRPMFSRTEMESMCARDLDKTGTRGTRNALKQREKKRDLVRSLPNDILSRLQFGFKHPQIRNLVRSGYNMDPLKV